jgi:hypothetical protein
MKALLGLLIVVGGLGAALYYSGMFEFDPVQQAKDAKASVQIGMSWEKVADKVGEPKEYRIFVSSKKMIGGKEVEIIKLGPANKFNRANLKQRIADGSLPYGFTFTYVFTAAESFDIVFDATGAVSSVQDNVGIKRLFDME